MKQVLSIFFVSLFAGIAVGITATQMIYSFPLVVGIINALCIASVIVLIGLRALGVSPQHLLTLGLTTSVIAGTTAYVYSSLVNLFFAEVGLVQFNSGALAAVQVSSIWQGVGVFASIAVAAAAVSGYYLWRARPVKLDKR